MGLADGTEPTDFENAQTLEDLGNESSSDDEDFNPTNEGRNVEANSEDEDDSDKGAKARQGPRQKKAGFSKATQKQDEEGLQDVELDSGDEVTITQGRGKRQMKDTKAEDEYDDSDEGGEGGLIKTRAQRAREKEEKKPLAQTEGSTVDVNALWASMTSPTAEAKSDSQSQKDLPSSGGPSNGAEKTSQHENQVSNGKDLVLPQHSKDLLKEEKIEGNGTSSEEGMIMIKRVYDFAGETMTEEKQVPKSSAEAKLYLQSQDAEKQQNSFAASGKPPLRRPKKRTSMFEPNPTGEVKALKTSAAAKKGPKLNTIEKSKLDWAGYVDKEGLADDLDEHSRAKEGYLNRMDFLGRMEAKREEEWKAKKKS